MKKIGILLGMLCFVLALTACGEKEQKVTYRLESEENNLKMVDTMTMTAKGDHVQRLEEVIEMDITAFDEETQEMLYAVYDELVVGYQAVKGVECTGEAGDGTYVIHIGIDATGDAVAELADQGLLEVEGDSEGISLKLTSETLESEGYVLVEQSEQKK